jgi:murein DD-endopeptidase MepM/ murein hydrolase activator NlpD
MVKRTGILIILLLFFSGAVLAKEYTVQRGDTLYYLLSDIFTPSEILDISADIKQKAPDFRLQVGDKLTINEDGAVIEVNISKEIHIKRTNESDISVQVVKYPVNVLRTVVSGEINDSLFYSMRRVGESDILAIKLAEILEWEVDFFKDIRKGDLFNIVVEKKFCRNKFIGYGRILAVDFVNNGRFIRGLYYENGKFSGYFSPNGKSLQRGFLKAPLKFARISSKFQHRRLHPVLNVYRPHYGVDYAAPTGTPVHATADGTVKVKGYTKGNGNYVKLSHNNGYETMYLHFSRFKSGLKRGQFVKQGEVIGYVGSTGYSTGSHVDYRIKKHGRYINPLRFKSPTKKLPEKEMALFKQSTQMYANLLDYSYLRYAFRDYGLDGVSIN